MENSERDFRLIATGAAGGRVPWAGGRNWGGGVSARLLLAEGDQLDIVVGQPGAGPCDDWKEHALNRSYPLSVASPLTKQSLDLLWSCDLQQQGTLARICTSGEKPEGVSPVIFPPHLPQPLPARSQLKLPGSGGGGATWVAKVVRGVKHLRRRLLLVAGCLLSSHATRHGSWVVIRWRWGLVAPGGSESRGRKTGGQLLAQRLIHRRHHRQRLSCHFRFAAAPMFLANQLGLT